MGTTQITTNETYEDTSEAHPNFNISELTSAALVTGLFLAVAWNNFGSIINKAYELLPHNFSDITESIINHSVR